MDKILEDTELQTLFYLQHLQAQCILSPGCHVRTFGTQTYKSVPFHGHTAFSGNTALSQQFITKAKWALLLQQKLPTNLWRWDGHEQPQWESRNSLC